MKIKILCITIILTASILAVRQLPFINFFASHDDTTPLRQLEMHKCFIDFQIPCRWVPDMGNGFGYPLFNYYPPLPYLVGEPFMVLGLDQYNAVKISFFLSLFLSGLAAYFLGRHIFNDPAGLTAGIFYIWAPYRALDVYVRGALNESWSFVFIPLIILFTYNLIFTNKRFANISLLSFAVAGLLLSHNVIALIFVPFYLAWIISVIFLSKSIKRLFGVICAGLLGTGVASYFTFPAFFERHFVWLDFTSGYFSFQNHFVYFNQLFFDRFWGYGMSFSGSGDGMSFQVGHSLYILAISSIVFLIIKAIYSHLTKKGFNLRISDFIAIIMFVLAILAAFMTTDYSRFIWETFPFLSITQFPWRFLTLTTFFFSMSAAYFVFHLKPGWGYVVSTVAIISIITLNWNYFLPDKTNTYRSDSTAGNTLKDFLPKTSIDGLPGSRNENLITIQNDYIYNISEVQSGTNWFNFTIESDNSFPLTVNILQFPNWKVFVDDKEVHDKTDSTGRIVISIPPGVRSISAHLANTPVRSFSNILSLMSILISLSVLGYSIRKNDH